MLILMLVLLRLNCGSSLTFENVIQPVRMELIMGLRKTRVLACIWVRIVCEFVFWVSARGQWAASFPGQMLYSHSVINFLSIIYILLWRHSFVSSYHFLLALCVDWQCLIVDKSISKRSIVLSRLLCAVDFWAHIRVEYVICDIDVCVVSLCFVSFRILAFNSRNSSIYRYHNFDWRMAENNSVTGSINFRPTHATFVCSLWFIKRLFACIHGTQLSHGEFQREVQFHPTNCTYSICDLPRGMFWKRGNANARIDLSNE